jgi:DNA-binding HxlR family transcriptional regulator
MFQYLNSSQIEEFIKKFPEAYSWLIGENLKQEYKNLNELLQHTTSVNRIEWIKQRLEDLERCGIKEWL